MLSMLMFGGKIELQIGGINEVKRTYRKI
jgi:hypothetical protein